MKTDPIKTMTDRPTPETDEMEREALDQGIYTRKPGYPRPVPADFARELERQRDEARDERDYAIEQRRCECGFDDACRDIARAALDKARGDLPNTKTEGPAESGPSNPIKTHE